MGEKGGSGKMATASSRPYQQDLPPKGGYAPFEYMRVPIRKFMSPARMWTSFVLITSFGYYTYYHKKRLYKAIKVEERSTDMALAPMLQAERDRVYIKQMIKNREFEAELMKDVDGWEVGTYFGKPVFKTLEDNKYPYFSPLEYYMHCSTPQMRSDLHEKHWWVL